MGFRGNEWKISVYNCSGIEETSVIRKQEDLQHFNFESKNGGLLHEKPRGLWFSNFYEYEYEYWPQDEYEDMEGHFSGSWIEWCIENLPGRIKPGKCKIIIARFNKNELFNVEGLEEEKFDWNQVAHEYAGINGGWGPADESFRGRWDVPSWIAFNPEAFEEVHLFHADDIM